jgi:PAS domain-containing protein
MHESASQVRPCQFAASASRGLLGALIVLVEDGTIVFWNERAVSLFGYCVMRSISTNDAFRSLINRRH